MQLAHLLGQRDADARALGHYEKVTCRPSCPGRVLMRFEGRFRITFAISVCLEIRFWTRSWITTESNSSRQQKIFSKSQGSVCVYYPSHLQRLILSSETFYQAWKPTKSFRFPLDLPQFPDGHDTLLQEWNSLKAMGSEYFAGFFQKLSIETNHLESTFLLTTSVRLLIGWLMIAINVTTVNQRSDSSRHR